MVDVPAAADILRQKAPDLARDLAQHLPLGRPAVVVVGDLRFLLDVFATALELGSCGLVDRTLAWQKVRTRALGGEPEALTGLPAFVAARLAPALDAGQHSLLTRLMDNAATYVHFASDTNPVGVDPLLQPGTLGREFLDATMAGDRLLAQATLRSAGSLPHALRTVVEPAQREFGRMWQNGLMPPPVEHVTTQVVHHVVESLAAEQTPPPSDAPLVAMVRAPGDEHSLGQLCAACHLRGAGLRTQSLSAANGEAALVASLAALAPAAIALTCTTGIEARRLAALVAAIRRERQLAHALVLLGGHLMVDCPQLPTHLGADGGACDGATLASQLQARLLQGTATAAEHGPKLRPR
ncbi:MAG: B12-binding domain-containing protein [Planctomycetota bacterium]|jgi:hypothetical protein